MQINSAVLNMINLPFGLHETWMLSAVWLSTLQFDKLSGGPYDWSNWIRVMRVFVCFLLFTTFKLTKQSIGWEKNSNRNAERRWIFKNNTHMSTILLIVPLVFLLSLLSVNLILLLWSDCLQSTKLHMLFRTFILILSFFFYDSLGYSDFGQTVSC